MKGAQALHIAIVAKRTTLGTLSQLKYRVFMLYYLEIGRNHRQKL